MNTDISYYPADGNYWVPEKSMFAQYLGDYPTPCRKYHVSSALEGAELVSATVLPYLAKRRVFHKVVRSRSCLSKQMASDQAGKFITVYLPAHVEHRNALLLDLGEVLLAMHEQGLIHPSPRIPRSRPHHHLFIETPIDRGGFIYGGAIVDPTV